MTGPYGGGGPDHVDLVGKDAALQRVEKTLKDASPPYDGMLGFSQGGCLVSDMRSYAIPTLATAALQPAERRTFQSRRSRRQCGWPRCRPVASSTRECLPSNSSSSRARVSQRTTRECHVAVPQPHPRLTRDSYCYPLTSASSNSVAHSCVGLFAASLPKIDLPAFVTYNEDDGAVHQMLTLRARTCPQSRAVL